MKIGLFADSHYCADETKNKTRRPKLSLEKVKTAMQYFKSVDADMCICLGDLTDSACEDFSVPDPLENILEIIKTYNIPFYCVPGNHDYMDYSAEKFFELIGTALPPYIVETPNLSLIILDANYRSDYRRFDVAGVQWTDSNLPPEQSLFLENALAASKKQCIVFVHENLDFNVEEHHIIKNADEVRRIIEKSGKVKTVVQGHYHLGADNIINGVRYFTLPAMCEGTQNRFAVLEISAEGKCSILQNY